MKRCGNRKAKARACRSALLFAVLAVLAQVPGCGPPPPADVSGTITLGGKAPDLKGLEIVFLSANGRRFVATVNGDGTYVAASVPIGEAKVAFVYIPPEAIQGKRKHVPDPQAAPKSNPSTWNPIPEDLREPAKSGVTLVVEPGKANVFNYDVVPRLPP